MLFSLLFSGNEALYPGKVGGVGKGVTASFKGHSSQ